MMSMCLLKLGCWSRVRPRYLASKMCVSVPSQNLYDMVNGDNLFDIVSATHFEELNCINQVSAHFSKRNKSCCSMLASDIQSIFLYSRQSSANKWHVEFKHKGKSLMNIRNSNGPTTEPCGTPLSTFAGPEVQPSHTTLCMRSRKNEAIQSKTWPLIP